MPKVVDDAFAAKLEKWWFADFSPGDFSGSNGNWDNVLNEGYFRIVFLLYDYFEDVVAIFRYAHPFLWRHIADCCNVKKRSITDI